MSFTEIEQRAAVLGAAPDMASITLGSMNFPNQASVNAPETIRELARRMRERGIFPELEIFDWMDPETKREPATNARLIERIVAVARAHGREIASCADARRMLGLRPSGEVV